MNGDLILIIPVLLIIVAIMFLVRHMRGGSDDSIAALIGIVPIVIVIGVAIGIIVSMASIADPWEWDADSKTLTIDGNIHDTGLSYPWTGYADRVESLVIEPGVEFIQGPAFARMTNLEYVDIAEGVTLDDGAFSQTFKDPFDADIAMTDVAGYEYVANEGVMYQCDPGLYKLFDSEVNGFATGVTGVKVAVLPSKINGITITGIVDRAFRDNVDLVLVTDFPDSRIVRTGINCFTADTSLLKVRLSALTTLGNYCFQGCTSLASFEAPEAVTLGSYAFDGTGITSAEYPNATSLGQRCYRNCTSLVSFKGPSVTSLENDAFSGCTSLASIDLPKVKSIGTGAFTSAVFTNLYLPELETMDSYAFQGCASMTSADFPKVTSIGARAFSGCTSIEEVSFGSSLETVASDSFNSWTFYASDGTTLIDKSVAANLAGKTFQGTAAALVEVAPGILSLTPDQLQKVHLHDAELERIRLEAISIGPLPFELQDE